MTRPHYNTRFVCALSKKKRKNWWLLETTLAPDTSAKPTRSTKLHDPRSSNAEPVHAALLHTPPGSHLPRFPPRRRRDAYDTKLLDALQSLALGSFTAACMQRRSYKALNRAGPNWQPSFGGLPERACRMCLLRGQYGHTALYDEAAAVFAGLVSSLLGPTVSSARCWTAVCMLGLAF